MKMMSNDVVLMVRFAVEHKRIHFAMMVVFPHTVTRIEDWSFEASKNYTKAP